MTGHHLHSEMQTHICLCLLLYQKKYHQVCAEHSSSFYLTNIISTHRGQLQCAKIRMDCTEKGRLLCANCNIPSILEIDILGRVAHIGDQKLVLSLCCASIIYYKGTGCTHIFLHLVSSFEEMWLVCFQETNSVLYVDLSV